ncbi:hypothetical protein O3P69_017241 [Scylla paramamosain]|uniref:Uncharacterized protein n=1 Tax=Scylla paramamosain TaxID=85552 RepID=A0AAW0TY18_SCYPA
MRGAARSCETRQGAGSSVVRQSLEATQYGPGRFISLGIFASLLPLELAVNPKGAPVFKCSDRVGVARDGGRAASPSLGPDAHRPGRPRPFQRPQAACRGCAERGRAGGGR